MTLTLENTLQAVELTKDERLILASAINHFGEGDHPWAGPGNLHRFSRKYAAGCLERARKVARQPHRRTVDLLINKLSSQQVPT